MTSTGNRNNRPASFFWPASADMAAQPAARLETTDDGTPIAVIDLAENGVLTMHVRTRGQADALIRAALAARDMLPEDTPGSAS